MAAAHNPPARLVVLISGAGTNLQALLEASTDPSYGAAVVAVLSDRADPAALRGLDRAKAVGVPTAVLAPGEHRDRAAWDAALTAAVAAHRPDLVVSAGFMRLLGPSFRSRFPIVNIHPALLPSFPGAHAVRDALDYGVKVTGSTVHLVDEGVDTGPVVAQEAVPVLVSDDEQSLHERIKGVERALLVDVVGRMARSGWTVTGRKVTIP